jgi:magnesium chelatase family protein
MHLEVPVVEYGELAEQGRAESSETVRSRVEEARALQRGRLSGKGRRCNAAMGPAMIGLHCRLDRNGDSLLRSATERFGLSARGVHRILKMARTVADLRGAGDVGEEDLAEAIQYRCPAGCLR